MHAITWLDAVQAVAREAALAEDRGRQGWAADDPRLPPFPYRWEHVQQVVRNGAWLLTQVAADEAVVFAACWLHDVKKQEPHHAARGADFARAFLPQTDFPPDKIEAVAQAIAQHEGLWRPAEGWQPTQPFRPAPPLEPVAVALLWDADKLAKVGPVAFLHFHPAHLADLHAAGQTTTTEELLQRNRYWLETLAPRTLASFNTLAAQRRALHYHAAYELFWQVAEEGLWNNLG